MKTINVQHNVQSVSDEVADVSISFEDLDGILTELGHSVSKAFSPIIDSLHNMETGIFAVTDALSITNSTLKEFLTTMEDSKVQTSWYEGIYKITVDFLPMILKEKDLKKLFDSVGSFIKSAGRWIANVFAPAINGALLSAGSWISGTLIPAITGALSSLAAALGISVGALVGIIAAVVLAIAALVAVIVIYWDEIVFFFSDTLPQLWEKFVAWISGVAETIGEFFADCWNGIVYLWNGFAQWVQDNIIQPVADLISGIVAWFRTLFSSIWQTITDVFYNIGVIIKGIWMIIEAVWNVVAIWFEQNVIQPLAQFFEGLWTRISSLAAEAWATIQNVFLTVAVWFNENVIQPVANFFAGLWEGIVGAASTVWEAIKGVFSTVANFFKDIFSKAWNGVVKVFSAAGEIFTNIKNAVLDVFKKIVNGLIDGINTVVAIPFNGINGALKLVKDIEILGITPFEDLRMINVPQIPHLAQGAVLPANKPFLAMVGDQRHGTNVEEHLATIQEAVAQVMENQFSGMMAGFEASVAVQKQILQAVLGIEVGDTVIGQAANRYNRRMAIIKGGM